MTAMAPQAAVAYGMVASALFTRHLYDEWGSQFATRDDQPEHTSLSKKT